MIGLYALYILIQAAIDNSATAKILREIKNLLEEQNKSNLDKNSDVKIIDYDFELGTYEVCPACAEKVSSNARECPSCGLTLLD